MKRLETLYVPKVQRGKAPKPRFYLRWEDDLLPLAVIEPDAGASRSQAWALLVQMIADFNAARETEPFNLDASAALIETALAAMETK